MSGESSAPTRVKLPVGVERPFEVFLNGVAQEEGRDFVVRDGELVFRTRLEREKVGKGRWTSMFLGISGSYGKDDSVDVVYTLDGKRHVATRLPFRS
ncbi:MAG: hypothetical protein U0R50_06720 [Gaiellales bacterium]